MAWAQETDTSLFRRFDKVHIDLRFTNWDFPRVAMMAYSSGLGRMESTADACARTINALWAMGVACGEISVLGLDDRHLDRDEFVSLMSDLINERVEGQQVVCKAK